MKDVEKILREYDRGNDNGRSYREYYSDIFEPYYEPNMFEVERNERKMD